MAMRAAEVQAVVRLQLGRELGRENELHDQGQTRELLLHALDIAAHGFYASGGGAGFAIRDAISAAVQEGTNQLGGLPRVEAGLLQLFAQVG